MNEPRFLPIGDRSSARAARPAAEVDRRTFGVLIGRVEQLSRELGRNEGRQIALQQQIARLEGQMAALRRGSRVES